MGLKIGVVVAIVLEDCHHLVVSYNRLSHGFDVAIFVDDDACSGVCTPIAHVVEFFSQDFFDPFHCMACRFAISGTDSFDYVGNGYVSK